MGRCPGSSTAHPELAWCGLTEEQARELGHDVVVSTHRFGGDGRAMIIGETDGLVKLVADADGLLLGVHVVGPWATELLAEGYLAVNWEATRRRRRRARAPAPTLSEVFGEAALSLTGPRSIDRDDRATPDDRRTAWT